MPKYTIIDEPRPGMLARVAVRPFWPLLAFMFSTSLIAWPWFVINGFAIGSPRRFKILGLGVLAFVLSFLAVLFVIGVVRSKSVGHTSIRLLVLCTFVLKLAFSYVLYVMQARDIELFEYYRGTVRNGIFVAILAYLAASQFLQPLPDLLWLLLR